MKNFTLRFAAFALSLCAAFAFVACENDDSDKTLPVSDATVQVQVTAQTPESADLTITTSAAEAAAYYRTTDMKFRASGEFVFRNGVEIQPNTAVSISMPYLETMADYRIITAAKAANGGYTVNYTDIHVPDRPTSISITVDKIRAKKITATFTPDDYTKSYKIGIGRATSTVDQFLADEIETTTIDGNEPNTIEIEGLSPEENYIIYAQSYNNEGPGCDVVTTTVKTAVAPAVDINVTMDNVIMADVKITPNEVTSRYIYLAASAEIFDEYSALFGGDVALLETFYELGEAGMGEGPSESQWELNGSCSYEYLIACVIYDEDGEAYDVVKTYFTSPEKVEGAPEASVQITVGEVTSTSAQLIYNMSGGTLGYYQAVYSESNYLELMEQGGVDYVFQYTAFYGSLMMENDDYVWPRLTPGTKYIAVGCPFNVNGIDGYGQMATAEFTTPDGSSATSAAGNTAGKRSRNIRRGLISADQIKAIKH